MAKLTISEVAIVNDQHLFSGTSTHAYKIYKNLREHNIASEIHQFLISNDKPKEDNLFIKYGLLHNYNGNSKYVYDAKLAFNFLTGLNWRSFKEIKSNIILLSGPTLLPLARYSAKSIVIGHDLFFLENPGGSIFLASYMKRMYKAFKNVNCVMVNSEFTRNVFIRSLKLDQNRVQVVYPYVDSDVFYPGNSNVKDFLKVKEEDIVILSVGGDEPNKNIESVLKLLKKLPDNYKLIRVGRNFNTVKMIDNLGLVKRVITLGNVDIKLLSELYRGCNFFIFPSLSEGFGIPLIEAMASGIPFIASNRASLPEVAGDSGIICEPHDIECMLKAVIELNSDDSLRKYYVDKGLKRAMEFSKEKQFQSLSKVLRLVNNEI